MSESAMGLMTKMPSPATAQANLERKTASETPSNAGSPGLHSTERTRRTTCTGSDTRTVRTRPWILTLSALLITMDTTRHAENKNVTEYPTPNDPNTAVLSSGYEQSTVEASPEDSTEQLELQK